MKKSFLSVCFVVLVIGLMFSISSCQKKAAEDTGEQPAVESTDTEAPAPEAEPAPEMTPAPEETPAPEAAPTDTAAPGTEVPAPPAAEDTAQ